jgi:hypothetical protein
LKCKQDGVLDKNRTMDNVQKHNIFTNVPSSKTFKSDDTDLGTFKKHIQMLQEHEHSPEPDAAKEWIWNSITSISQAETFTIPSHECDMPVNLAFEGALKVVFSEKSLPNFWFYVCSRFSELSDGATKHILKTYNYKLRFPYLLEIKPC